MIFIENLINELLDNIYYFSDVFMKHIIKEEKYNAEIKAIYNKIGQRQWDILFLLLNTDFNTTSAIGDELCLSRSSVSLTVSKMVKLNLVTKSYSDNENDSRIVLLKVTDEGRILYEALYGKIISFMDRNLKDLTNEETKIVEQGFIQVNKLANLINIEELKIDDFRNMDIKRFFSGVFLFKLKTINMTNEIRKNISSDLGYSEFGILDLVYKYKVNTPKEISDILLKKESSISFQLSNLVKRKYLVREKKGEDVRKTFFNITEKGIKEYNIVDSTMTSFIKSNLKNFNPDIVYSMNQSILCFISFFNLLNEKEGDRTK